MVRKWIAFGLLFGFVGFIGFVAGCGQAQQAAAPSGQAVTISGTVAASQADLAQLGVSALSVKSSGSVDLTTRGFTSKSVKAANLVPYSVGGTTITIGVLTASGSLTAVASATVNSDGTYSVTIPDYDPDKTYGAVVTKTSSDTNKTLEYKVIYPAATGGEIKESDAAISPQTTLVAQMIIEKVVKVLEAANIDPKVIANVKDAIISAVDTLISSGAIIVNCVRDATAVENSRLLDAIDEASNDTTIAGKLDSIKGALGLTKATDLDSAKGAIYELFKMMTGDPRGIPESIVNAFAESFRAGTTKTVSEVTTALNSALYNPTTKDPVTGTFTDTKVSSEIQNNLRAVFGGTATDMTSGVKSVVEAVFPKTEWNTKTITGSTTLSVPQIILLVFLGEKLAGEAGYAFNSPQAASALGLMSGIENKLAIMHSEIRIISFEDWQNFTPTGPSDKPTPTRALTSWVDIGNPVGYTDSTGVTCQLKYPKANGETGTADYTEMVPTGSGTEGPPPGWKNFSINPWGMGPDNPGTVINDFAGGTATIIVKKGGTEIDRKSVTIVNIDLSLADIAVNIPKPAWIDHPENISKFPKGSQPTFNWKLNSVGITLPAGYRLGYAISVREGTFMSGGPGGGSFFFVNYGDSSTKIFDSWDKQDFPMATAGETLNWLVPAAIDANAVCEFGITLVAIDKTTNQPVAEGTHRSGLFIVGSPDIPDSFGGTPVYEDISTKSLTLTGKVHSDILTRFTGANVKVGLFKEAYDPTAGFKLSKVSGVAPVGLTAIEGSSHKDFSLPFSGSVFAANYGAYSVILWNDADKNGDFDMGEDQERSQKSIDHQSFGTKAYWPSGGDDLMNSQSDFNFLYWGDSF